MPVGGTTHQFPALGMKGIGATTPGQATLAFGTEVTLATETGVTQKLQQSQVVATTEMQ